MWRGYKESTTDEVWSKFSADVVELEGSLVVELPLMMVGGSVGMPHIVASTIQPHVWLLLV